MDVDVANRVIFVIDLSWKLIICLLGCKEWKWKLSKQIILQKMTFSKQIIRQKMIFSKQIIRPKMTFSKEIIFLRGEGFGIFYTCEVFDFFELFEVGGGIKYA